MSDSSSPLYGPDGNHVTAPEQMTAVALRTQGFPMPFHPSMTSTFLAERSTDQGGQFMVPAQVLLTWLETYHAFQERDVKIEALHMRLEERDAELAALVARVEQLEKVEQLGSTASDGATSREADKP